MWLMTILWYLRLIIMNSWANHHESWENFHTRFPWFRTEHRSIQPDARINLWCQSYWSASKIYNLEYLFWIKSSRRPEIPPKDWGAFINFVARLKRWLWYSYDHSLILTLNHHDSWAAILERKKKEKEKKERKTWKRNNRSFADCFRMIFFGSNNWATSLLVFSNPTWHPL